MTIWYNKLWYIVYTVSQKWEIECTLHNSIVLAIFVSKIIKVNGWKFDEVLNFWRKHFWLFFETLCIVSFRPNATGDDDDD